jgi:hypothetical protein
MVSDRLRALRARVNSLIKKLGDRTLYRFSLSRNGVSRVHGTLYACAAALASESPQRIPFFRNSHRRHRVITTSTAK